MKPISKTSCVRTASSGRLASRKLERCRKITEHRVCGEKARLVMAYDAEVRLYTLAVERSNKAPHGNPALEQEEARVCCESARKRCELIRGELRNHVNEHGC